MIREEKEEHERKNRINNNIANNCEFDLSLCSCVFWSLIKCENCSQTSMILVCSLPAVCTNKRCIKNSHHHLISRVNIIPNKHTVNCIVFFLDCWNSLTQSAHGFNDAKCKNANSSEIRSRKHIIINIELSIFSFAFNK